MRERGCFFFPDVMTLLKITRIRQYIVESELYTLKRVYIQEIFIA